MVLGLLFEENKMPLCFPGKFEQFIGAMGIVTQDNGFGTQLILNGAILFHFVAVRVITVIDEKIDRLIELTRTRRSLSISAFQSGFVRSWASKWASLA